MLGRLSLVSPPDLTVCSGQLCTPAMPPLTPCREDCLPFISPGSDSWLASLGLGIRCPAPSWVCPQHCLAHTNFSGLGQVCPHTAGVEGRNQALLLSSPAPAEWKRSTHVYFPAASGWSRQDSCNLGFWSKGLLLLCVWARALFKKRCASGNVIIVKKMNKISPSNPSSLQR